MEKIKSAILWIGKEFVKKIISGIIASLSITAFVAAFILSKGNEFYSNFISCRAQNFGLWRCSMNNLDWATLLLISSFALIWLFVVVRRKIDNMFIYSQFFDEINAVKRLYSLLEDFPYEANDFQKRQYSLNSSQYVEDVIKTLMRLKTQIYKEEKLRDYVGFLTNNLLKQNQDVQPSPIVPRFDSRIEFNQSKREIRRVIDYVIKCLENNRVG